MRRWLNMRPGSRPERLHDGAYKVMTFLKVYAMLDAESGYPGDRVGSNEMGVRRETGRKPWTKPVVKQLDAGAAENTNTGTFSDGATTGPKRS